MLEYIESRIKELDKDSSRHHAEALQMKKDGEEMGLIKEQLSLSHFARAQAGELRRLLCETGIEL